MNFILILYFFIACADVFIAVLVLSNDYKKKINLTFGLISIFAAFWISFIGLYSQAESAAAALLWSRFALAVSVLFPLLLTYFVSFFPADEKLPLTISLAGSISITIFFVFSFTGLLVKEVVCGEHGYQLVLGPIFPAFVLYYLFFIYYSLDHLHKKIKKNTGQIGIQIKYLYIAFLIGTIFPVITNLILPLLNVSVFTSIGPVFTFFTLLIIAYSILKHRLMSIEIIIQKGLIYTAASVFILGAYALAVTFSEQILKQAFGYTSIIITTFFVFALAVVFQPLIRFLQDLTDRVFFRQRYNYQQALRNLSYDILTKIKMEELVHLIVSTFVDTMRVSQVSFLVRDEEKRSYTAIEYNLAGQLETYKLVDIPLQSKLVEYLSASKNILAADEIPAEIDRLNSFSEKDPLQIDLFKEVEAEIKSYNFKLWIPVILKDELAAIIVLGEKLSGDIFSDEDIALLNTVANQTALALDNVRLYKEVLEIKNYNQEILNSLLYGVMTIDEEGIIKTCNPAMRKILGVPAESALGKKYEEILSPKSPITLSIEKTQESCSMQNFEASIISKNSGMIPVMISTSILYDACSKKRGVILTLRDLTEIKKLENKARQADKLKALSTMSAGMAHEIKNPLSSLKIIAQLLPQKYDNPEFRRKMLEIIPHEVARIDRIVESLLQFTRGVHMKLTAVSIEKLLDEIIAYYEIRARDSNIEICKDYAEVPQIMADKNQASQAFSNFMLNAIQSMPEGGKLTVSVKPSKKDKIAVSITDTGHGIIPEDLKHLFEPFFTTKYEGSGLGLTIAHSIIESHQGEIKVKSKIGAGTTFEVYLPVEQ